LPLYPYRCTQCGHRFEKIQSFKSKPLTKCPKCEGTLERVLTAPGLSFKGSGWYVNDYASKGGSGSSSAETGSSGETATAEKGKADTKAGAETKTESKAESKKSSGESGASNSAAPASTPASGSSKS
jgi:putative FmdB family regulatory protein